MKIEWLVIDVTAIGSLDRAERANLGLIVPGVFLANSVFFCGREAIL